jgi:hypothetical protein
VEVRIAHVMAVQFPWIRELLEYGFTEMLLHEVRRGIGERRILCGEKHRIAFRIKGALHVPYSAS